MKLVYLGNMLSKHGKAPSTIETLEPLFNTTFDEVVCASDRKNKLIRLIDMVLTVFKNRNATYVLIDTYSSFGFYYALILGLVCQVLNVKYIPILHGGNLPARIKKNPKLSKTLFKKAHLILSPSNYLKQAFANDGYDVTVVPNIIEIDLYSYKDRNVIAPKLLYVRAIHKVYNPTMAIEVVNMLKPKYDNIQLCMIGPHKDQSIDDVKKLVVQYHLEDNVEIVGQMPKEKWIERAADFDIFINTTNFDNTPVSVIEAMALGLPVVTTDVGGIPYLLSDSEDALLVEPRNPKKFANRIEELLNGTTNHKRIAANARVKAESFAWRNVREQWKAVLQ